MGSSRGGNRSCTTLFGIDGTQAPDWVGNVGRHRWMLAACARRYLVARLTPTPPPDA